MKRISDRRLERQAPGIMSPARIWGRKTGPASRRSSKPANCMASIRKPTSPTRSPSSSISGRPRALTNSCPGPGRPSSRPTNSRRNSNCGRKIKSSQLWIARPLTNDRVTRSLFQHPAAEPLLGSAALRTNRPGMLRLLACSISCTTDVLWLRRKSRRNPSNLRAHSARFGSPLDRSCVTAR
jgi:hypothetical protein